MDDEQLVQIISQGIVDGANDGNTIGDHARGVLRALREEGVLPGEGWEPPKDRRHGFKCMGFLRGRWHPLTWHPRWGWLDQEGGVRDPKQFMQDLPAPEAAK